MEKYYLIIDLGTGNSRVALVSSNGEIIELKAFENNYYKDDSYEDAQYFLPKEWSKIILNYIKEIILKHPQKLISAITSSGARQSIVLYDKNKSDFYGLPNIDNRGEKWINEVGNADEIYEKSGRWLTCDFPAAKLLGLKKVHKRIYDDVYKITSLSEWIGTIFTGEIAIEPSQACETQLFDIETCDWSDNLCKYFEVDKNILPKIKNSGSILGNIKPEIASELGIDANCVFVIGGADTQVALKSVYINEGETAIVSGTTSPVVSICKDKLYDNKKRCWIDCNLKGLNYQIETNPGVTGLNYQRFKNAFFEDVSYADIDSALLKKEDYKCIASFTTLFFQDAKSIKSGGFTMRPPFKADIDKFDFMWALCADIACAIYEQYKNLTQLVKNDKDYILGCGGGFQSKFIAQMISDLTQKKIVVNNGYSQASIIGGLLVCNEYFNIFNVKTNGLEIEYLPKENNIITCYYEEWKTTRIKINNI